MAWVQDDEQGQDSIWAASIAAATTGVPQLIDTYTADSAGEVDIAISADGSRGMAVWQQRNGSTSASLHYNEWSRASAGTGFTWKGPMLVHNADWVSSPAVVIDRTGQAATVAFVQPLIGYRWNVLQTRWTPSAGWSAAQPLETTNQAGGDAESPPGHRRRGQRPRRLAAQGRRRRQRPCQGDRAPLPGRRDGLGPGGGDRRGPRPQGLPPRDRRRR